MFETTRYYYVLASRGASQLGQSERLTYSALVHFLKFDVRASAAEVSRATGLDPRTVTHALQKLESVALVKDMAPQEPTGETAGWFVRFASKREGWEWGLASYKVYCPGEELTAGQAAIYGLLVSLAKGERICKGRSYAGLASMLGNHRNTCATDIARLKAAGGLEVFPAKKHKELFAVKFSHSENFASMFQTNARTEEYEGLDDEPEYEGLEEDTKDEKVKAEVAATSVMDSQYAAGFTLLVEEDKNNPVVLTNLATMLPLLRQMSYSGEALYQLVKECMKEKKQGISTASFLVLHRVKRIFDQTEGEWQRLSARLDRQAAIEATANEWARKQLEPLGLTIIPAIPRAICCDEEVYAYSPFILEDEKTKGIRKAIEAALAVEERGTLPKCDLRHRVFGCRHCKKKRDEIVINVMEWAEYLGYNFAVLVSTEAPVAPTLPTPTLPTPIVNPVSHQRSLADQMMVDQILTAHSELSTLC